MWPFSSKKKETKTAMAAPVSEALQTLAAIGIRTRPGISNEDLLLSLAGSMDSKVEMLDLLCTLGSEVDRDGFHRISDDIWHFDAECIENHGDYVAVVNRFVTLAKGALPITNIRDYVDVEEGKTWVEFELDGKTVHWDLEADNDWVDPELYCRLQELVTPRGAGKRFFIVALGQDSLISFGDEEMKKKLSLLAGLDFQWE